MIFRIVMVCLALAGAYALYEIYSIKRYYAEFREPLAEFTAMNVGNQASLTIVEFLDYDCGPCKDNHLLLLDYAQRNPDVRLVVRPVPFAHDGAETAAEMALAAGLQGKFWELDRALVEYKGPLNDKFYRESAAVYDIDYERMVREAEEETVQEMAANNAGAFQSSGMKRTSAIMIENTFFELDKPLTQSDLILMVESAKRN